MGQAALVAEVVVVVAQMSFDNWDDVDELLEALWKWLFGVPWDVELEGRDD